MRGECSRLESKTGLPGTKWLLELIRNEKSGLARVHSSKRNYLSPKKGVNVLFGCYE